MIGRTILNPCRARLGGAGLLLMVAACGGPAPPPKTEAPPAAEAAAVPAAVEIRATIYPAQNVNPNIDGRPSPVELRLYQLRSATAFLASDFFSVFARDDQILAEDLLAREEFQLLPGRTEYYQAKRADGARFVAVFVAYRDYNRSHWRAIVALPDDALTGFDRSIPMFVEVAESAVNLEISGLSRSSHVVE